MNMTYKTFTFPQTPTALRISEARATREAVIPFAGTSLQDLGKKRRQVDGEGAFTGADCVETWNALQGLFAQGGEGFLFLPGHDPFLAVLDSLKLSGPPSNDAVKYSFRFIEALPPEIADRAKVFQAAAGETLWDYARRYGVTIERLVEANPEIRDIDALEAGQEVVIP